MGAHVSVTASFAASARHGAEEKESFLGVAANERRVATSTHNQARGALLFFYCEVLNVDLPWLDGMQRPRTPNCIPSF